MKKEVKIKRFIMLGEKRNGKIVKNEQYSVIDFAEISKKKFVLQFGVYTKSVIIDSTEMPGRKDDGQTNTG